MIAIGSAVYTGDSQCIFSIYSDSNNSPTTVKYRFIQQLSGSGRNIAPTGVIPVKKGDYFRVTYIYGGSNRPITAIYWIPLNCGAGSGSNVLSGSWCGLKMSSHINPIKTCDGHNPQIDCPSGYTSTLFATMGDLGGNWYSCFKD